MSFDELGGVVPVVGDTFYPMEPQKLLDLEATLGYSLPQDYRDFLLEHGAVSFAESVIAVAAETPPSWISDSESVPVGTFFGGTSPRESFSLAWHVTAFLDRLPSGLLPIATAAMSDLFVIDLAPEHYGAIYYWDAEHEPDDDDIEQAGGEVPRTNLFLVAASFSDLLGRLRPDPD